MPAAIKISETTQNERLESWKEIAAYLNCGERTAKRWEKTRSLPVRRLPGGKGQVFAYQGEVLAWRESNSPLSSIFVEPDAAITPEVEVLAATGSHSIVSETELAADAGRNEYPVTASPAPSLHRIALAGMALAVVFVAFFIYRAQTHKVAALSASAAAAAHVPPAKARDLYLEGRFYSNKRTPSDLQLAMADFQQAIALDNEYAPAYAGLADAYGLSTEFAAMPPQQAYPRMLDAAQHAISLDPGLATGHRAVGFALFYWDWDFAGARREFDRAIALDPQDATTFHWFANILQQGGDLPEALKMTDRARELDPASRSILADRGLILARLGRQAEADQTWAELEKSDPTYLPPHWYKANRAFERRDVTVFLGELHLIASITHSAVDADRVQRCESGLKSSGIDGLLEAEADFEVEKAQRMGAGYFFAANALDAAGRDQQALHYLQLAYAQRDPLIPLLNGTDHFTRLRGNPDYEKLVARSKLPYTEAGL